MSFLNDDEDLLEGSAEGSADGVESYGRTDFDLVTELPNENSITDYNDIMYRCPKDYISLETIKCEFLDGENSTFYQCVVLILLLIFVISLIIGIKRARYKQGQRSEDYY